METTPVIEDIEDKGLELLSLFAVLTPEEREAVWPELEKLKNDQKNIQIQDLPE